MTIQIDDLLVLLGKSSVNEKVKATLTALGIDPKKIRLKRGDFDVSVVAESYGTEFEFADPDKYVPTEPIPEGALVFGVILLSPIAASVLGPLPHGLDFGLARDKIRSELGNPGWSSPVAPIDRWTIDGNEVVIRFDRTSLKANRIIFSRPKKNRAG